MGVCVGVVAMSEVSDAVAVIPMCLSLIVQEAFVCFLTPCLNLESVN